MIIFALLVLTPVSWSRCTVHWLIRGLCKKKKEEKKHESTEEGKVWISHVHQATCRSVFSIFFVFLLLFFFSIITLAFIRRGVLSAVCSDLDLGWCQRISGGSLKKQQQQKRAGRRTKCKCGLNLFKTTDVQRPTGYRLLKKLFFFDSRVC